MSLYKTYFCTGGIPKICTLKLMSGLRDFLGKILICTSTDYVCGVCHYIFWV